ncbi:hypothetical protein ABVT39_013881 [Epinephelus coioides]
MLQTASSSSQLRLVVSLLLLLVLTVELFSGGLAESKRSGAVIIGFDTAASAGETADDPVGGDGVRINVGIFQPFPGVQIVRQLLHTVKLKER